ncbi:MAG: hypothetical protein K8R77_06325, partial [Anaerolineaceae bacterium]|nr:hypothetical protein [Anaerolineaceae bacterium]
LLLVLVFWAVFLFLLAVAVCTPFAIRLNNLRFILERIFSVLVWGIAALLETAIFLWFSYRSTSRFSVTKIWKTMVILVILAGSIMMWLITMFRMEFFTSIPFWVWFYHDMGQYDFLFLGVLAGAAAVVYWVLAGDENVRHKLLVLVLLGFALQASFGFIAGNGFASIQRMAENSAHMRYYERAADNPRLWDALTDYETHYGWDHFLGTKPPGVISFYIVMQRLSNLINPVTTYYGRLSRLTMFLAYAMPLITYLTLIPLYAFSKIFFKEQEIWLPLIFYLVFPNTLLQMLELDISLFPLLFLLALLLTHKVIRTQSFWWALVAGAAAYLSIFFSFSLLMLIPLSLAWIGIEYLYHWQDTNFWHKVKIICGYLLGVIALGLVFYGMFQYDAVQRYQSAITMHRQMKLLATGFEQLKDAWVLNSIEFTMWIGFPVAVLLVMRTVKSGLAFCQRRADALDRLYAAFLPTFILLNVFGQTRSEVGRLWAFFMPLVSIFITPEALRLFKQKKISVYFLLFLELITAFLIFKFQNALTDI